MSSSDGPISPELASAGLQLEKMLDNLIHRLVNADNGPDVRAALIEARRLKNVAMRWAAIPPQPDARREMLARVMELSESVTSVEGTARPRPGVFASSPPPDGTRPGSGRRVDMVTGPHQPFTPRSSKKPEPPLKVTEVVAPRTFDNAKGNDAQASRRESPSAKRVDAPPTKAPASTPPISPQRGPKSPPVLDLEDVTVPKPAPVPKIDQRPKPLTLRPPGLVDIDKKDDTEPFDRAASSMPKPTDKARPIQAVGGVRGEVLEGLSSTISSSKNLAVGRPSSIPAPPPTRPSSGAPPSDKGTRQLPRSAPPPPPPRRAPPPIPRRASSTTVEPVRPPPLSPISSRPPVLSAGPTPLPPAPHDVSVALADGVTLVRPGAAEWQPHPLWPGTSVKLLSHDAEKGDYSALVRLSRGASLPRRRHVGVEEMWMVDGVGLIGEVEMRAGEYLRADPGTEHPSVHTTSGCTFFIRGNENDEVLSEGKSGAPGAGGR